MKKTFPLLLLVCLVTSCVSVSVDKSLISDHGKVAVVSIAAENFRVMYIGPLVFSNYYKTVDIRHLNLDDKIEASVAKELREVYDLEAKPAPQFRQGVRDGQKSNLFGEYSYKLNDLLKEANEAGYGTLLFVESRKPMLEDWIGRSPHKPYHPGIYKRKWINSNVDEWVYGNQHMEILNTATGKRIDYYSGHEIQPSSIPAFPEKEEKLNIEDNVALIEKSVDLIIQDLVEWFARIFAEDKDASKMGNG